ncbi:MAG: helix-turn-helix domain-containing protein [Chromatiaceae bacterium]|jgi:transposase|nr:helix-turn-helix domain-containing protein [Chromatiaceae bacterium]
MKAEPIQLSDGLTNQQREGARLAASGWRQTDIAEHLGVAAETVSRWGKKPAYRAAIQALAGQAQARALSRLEALVDQAVSEIEQSLAFKYDQNTRLRAALAILRLVGVGTLGRSKVDAEG